jgi:hexosaminidase
MSMIERTLDGMAAVKLNVLHWHLSDDQGFRVESKRYPRLHRLGSDSLFYTQKEIQTVVAYARDRGIRVVPEFDMPGHSTSWFVGYPHLASLPGPFEITRTFGIGGAAFDPTRAEVYTFIDRFVGEMASLFPDPYWHMGGDEVIARHWNTSRIRAFKRRNGYRTNADLQAYFTRRVARILANHEKRAIGWDEVLNGKIPATTVVQAWRSESQLTKSTTAGFATIYSAPYYLDHIKTAEEHYNADPVPPWTSLTPAQQERVLGGEACMWAEAVDSTTVDSRLWPRLGAIAERFWSPREVNDVADMYRRLERLDQRLAEFGLDSRAHTERFVRRLVPNDSGARALLTVLEAVAPPTFGQRIRGQRPTQFTPLTGVLDAALPDPWGRWEAAAAVGALVADSIFGPPRGAGPMTRAQARARLQELFTRWRDAAASLRTHGAGSPGGAEAQPAADALARVSSIGLEALRYVESAEPAPPGWGEPLLAELTGLEQPQNLLRVVVVGPVRRLVAAAVGSPR